MKFRIEKNVIKFRLTPTEIELLKTNNKLSDNITITSSNRFDYMVKSNSTENMVSVNFDQNAITANIPQSMLDHWFDTENIGLRQDILNDDGESITIIVEEDLPPRKIKKEKK